MVGALTAVLKEIAEPGDRVVINTPVYHPFFAVVEEAGCALVEVPLAGTELDIKGIESAFADGARALILCSPHNPAGSVPSREQLEAIAESAARHGAWVLADEIHAPLALPGAEHVPFLTVSEAARRRGIAFWSASKAFNLAGLRCAEIVTASAEAAAVIERLPVSATHCGHLGAIASPASSSASPRHWSKRRSCGSAARSAAPSLPLRRGPRPAPVRRSRSGWEFRAAVRGSGSPLRDGR